MAMVANDLVSNCGIVANTRSDRDSRAGSVHSPRMPGNGRSLTPATAYSDPRVNARPSLSETSVKRARYADGMNALLPNRLM